MSQLGYIATDRPAIDGWLKQHAVASNRRGCGSHGVKLSNDRDQLLFDLLTLLRRGRVLFQLIGQVPSKVL